MTTVTSTRSGLFVGRESELEALAAVLGAERAGVVYVHGIAGIGKTALLGEFLATVRDAHAHVVELDCRAIEPTERGLLDAVGELEDVPALARRLAELPAPVLLVLDHVEVFRLMDTWLRRVLLPALPEGVHLVLAGREPPVAAWFAEPGFRSMPLPPLPPDDARRLLEQRGVREGDAVRLNRIARGHPLALTLASAGVSEHPELELEDAAMTRVIAELARLYLVDVGEPRARRALEAASIVRVVTEPLLDAMLGDGEGRDALDSLLALPFVETARDGLVVHEAVREAVSSFLRGTNPKLHRHLRQRAWRELREEVRAAPRAELWRYTADMLYLIDNPTVREAFFPSGAQPLAVEPAHSADAAAVCRIAHKHDGPEAAALVERWLAEAPESFSVIRDRDDAVVGFFSLLEGRMLRPPLVPEDPIVQAWAQHLREAPLPTGQTALGLRRWLDAERGELPSSSQAACWLDVKRTYMVLRPALRRMYVVVRDVATYWPVVEQLGFRPIGEPVTLDGAQYGNVALDFGPASVDGWLAGLAAAELGLSASLELDPEAREITVDGARVRLTPLEFSLLSHLYAREGRTVGRAELLREVWGTDYAGGSNVVDAIVRSLRQKLGPGAGSIETVRGSGYRLREDWLARLG